MNSQAIVLRKFRGRFGAAFRGFGSLFQLTPASGSAAVPSMRTVGAFFGMILMPFLLIAALAMFMLLLPSQTADAATVVHPAIMAKPALLGIAAAGTTTEEIKALFDKLQGAFNQFREANDERLKQIEAKGSADPLLLAKVERANADITAITAQLNETKAQLKEVENSNARLISMGGGAKAEDREREVLNTARFFSLVRGQPVANVTDEDIGAYRAYRGAFNTYLRQGQAAFRDADVRNALSTGAAPSGGFWLTPDSSGKIVEYLEDLSTMRRIASVSPISTDMFEGFYDLDEASSGWVGETDARGETNTPRIDGKYSFPIFEQYANPKASQKMLDDSETDVETWLAKKVAQKMAKTENTGFVSGNGVTRPMGFLSYAAGTPARTSVQNYRKIRQLATGVSGGFAASKPGDKFIDLIQAVPSALRQGAVFAMNPLTIAEVRKLVDGQGNYLFIPDFAKSPNGTLLGYQIEELNDMPDIGANSLSVGFGNFKEGYEIKDHTVGTRVLRDPYTGKPYVSFYTTKRVGGDVVNFQAIVLLKFG